jgi:hypothetical protein
VIKRTALICFSLLASSAAVPGLSHAQFVLPTSPMQMHEQDAAPAMPDEVHVVLMVRNAIVALSQANITGNYTVLREMGTADFQMTNSPARLAEIFATLRSRKIDLSPVMVFSPKYTSAPALEGPILRVAGYFPTAPEQVQFELAYQHSGDQWLLGGIAVSVAPPADGAQASAAPAGQLLQASAEPVSPSSGKSEAKQIHIDLNLPAGGQAAPAAPKKPAAVKKPKPAPAQKAAASQAAAPAPEAPAPAPQQAAPTPAPAPASSGPSWNPFDR